MEVCGSISANADYTEFLLNCIYCANENNLRDWQEFVLHIRNFHSSAEDAVEASVGDEDESFKDQADYYIDNINMDTIHENDEYHPDNEDLMENVYFEEMLSQESQDGDPNTTDFNETLESTENDKNEEVMQCAEENETEQTFEADSLSDYQDYKSKDENEEYDDELILQTDSSESEPEEQPAKRSRTNPLALKRNLKISFLRHNPRVVQFIEEFKKHPCLWNPDDPKFQDERAQSEAYIAITEVMDKRVNVLFTELELQKSIKQLLDQYTVAAQNANDKKLTGVAARYYNKCQFLSSTPVTTPSDDESSKSDVIQLNFKKINRMTTALIDAYANFPVLYDSSLPEFRSVDARTQAYIKMSEMLAPEMRVNETEVHLAVIGIRKWAYNALRRVKSKILRRPCTKPELHYLQLCSFLPPKMESFVINCDYCDKRFFIDYSLRSHMVKEHNVGELPYLCSQCPRRFVKAHDLERHKLRQHCVKLLKCEYCDSKFSLKTDLTVHTRIHTGEKPYVCELCGKSFRLKLLLDYHINGKHLDLRPYPCDLCPKRFRKRVELKNHVKGHLNIKDKKCEECGAAFTCPTSLCRHRKMHHSDRNKNT